MWNLYTSSWDRVILGLIVKVSTSILYFLPPTSFSLNLFIEQIKNNAERNTKEKEPKNPQEHTKTEELSAARISRSRFSLLLLFKLTENKTRAKTRTRMSSVHSTKCNKKWLSEKEEIRDSDPDHLSHFNPKALTKLQSCNPNPKIQTNPQ